MDGTALTLIGQAQRADGYKVAEVKTPPVTSFHWGSHAGDNIYAVSLFWDNRRVTPHPHPRSVTMTP